MLARLSLFIILVWQYGCGKSKQEAKEQPAPSPEPHSLSTPQLTGCWEGDSFTCALEAALVEASNRRRSDRSALQQDFESSFVARLWSAEQLRVNTLSHLGFPQDREQQIRDVFPYLQLRFRAENVAMLYTDLTSPEAIAEELVTMWWDSPGHRQNLLSNTVYLGAGVARDGRLIYATQLFH